MRLFCVIYTYLEHHPVAGHHVALADLGLVGVQVAAGSPPHLGPGSPVLPSCSTHRHLAHASAPPGGVEEYVVLLDSGAAENILNSFHGPLIAVYLRICNDTGSPQAYNLHKYRNLYI